MQNSRRALAVWWGLLLELFFKFDLLGVLIFGLLLLATSLVVDAIQGKRK